MLCSAQLVLLVICSILSLSEQVSRWYDVNRGEVEDEPVSWAVDLERGRPWWTHWLMGELADHELSVRADAIAAQFDLVNKGPQPGFKTIFKFEVPLSNSTSPGLRVKRDRQSVVEDIDDQLVRHPEVIWASRQRPLKRTKRLFNDPKFDSQWHLVNSREVGHDINIQGVWSLNITGRGVVVAVVDDGVEHSNVDLADNYNVAGSYDLNSGDTDPTPNLKTNIDNAHGTKCAGLIAAVANNSVCGVGVAYGAQVSGLRILDGTVTDLLEGRSFIYKAHINWVYSCSWGPEDNGMSVEGPGYVAKKALELGTSFGRYGYGSIFVFASGNGGLVNDNCNFDGYANSIYTLTVGAVDELNRMPYYAEPCPNTLAVTYSNGHAMNDRTIVTTDTSTKGGCTKGFTGTSAAAPIAAGMVALMLEVRPCLSWRDVQSILIYSAVKVDVKNAEWIQNGAGFHHSDQHGFGLMDAWRLSLAAAHWPLLPPMTNHSTQRQITHVDIPRDGSPLLKIVYISVVSLPPNLSTLEYVAVTLSLEHNCRGALEISLQSPTGTWSKLASSRKHDKSGDGLSGWTFTSARFWGESPNGTWTLKISQINNVCGEVDKRGGVLKDWRLTLYGSKVTPNDVTIRRSIIERSVANGTLEGKLSCPPLPENVQELELPMTTPKHHPVWEKVLLVVVAVLFGVLLIHLITDFIRSRWRAWQRRKQLMMNTTVIYQRLENGHDMGEEPGRGSGEESECEETTLLIRDQTCTTLEEHRELSVQVDCGDVAVNGVAECDELKRVEEEKDDNYRGTLHGGEEASDQGVPPSEDGSTLITATVENSLKDSNELPRQVR